MLSLTLVTGLLHAQTSFEDVFQGELGCALVESRLAAMPIEPVFAQGLDGCVSTVPGIENQNLFIDASCVTPLAFEPTSLDSYCEQLLEPRQLGEGQGINIPVWTLPPGAQLDIGARSLDGIMQPYLQRRIYRTVQTAGGSCSLEMRVYAPSPVSDDSERPSLLAFHGGSWSARAFGFLGLELSIPHYVDQGFVVYAPFYRLLGDAEGSVACRNASIEQIVDDAFAALAWVRDHAAEYGSSPTPVVFGQSAGAHLATSLAVDEAQSVAAAVLFYPPTDFSDFTLRAQQGFYTDEQGLAILRRVLGRDVDQVDINAAPIPQNSFPQRIVEQDMDVPPVMMVHGMQDTLVEARQSVRLCDALAGRELLALDDEVVALTSLRQRLRCGADSEVQLIREGQHALDVCITDTLFSSDLCPSGSEESREEVALAIGEAVAFASAQADVDTGSGDLNGENGEPVESRSDGIGSLSLWFLILTGTVAAFRYRRGLQYTTCPCTDPPDGSPR